MDRRVTWAALAAAATIGASSLLLPLTAHAGTSPNTTQFCTVPASWKDTCSISVPMTAAWDGTNEGNTVKGLLRGAPGKTFQFAVFKIKYDSSGKATGLTRVSAPASATMKSTGHGEVTLKVNKMASPMTGSKDAFVIALADSKDATKLVGTSLKKLDTFGVNSARADYRGEASKPLNGKHYTSTESISSKLEAGLPGDKYVVQLKVGGKWKTINADAQDNGLIRKSSLGTVHWSVKGVPAGTYDWRISNTENLDDPVATRKITIADGTTPSSKQPTATPPRNPGPPSVNPSKTPKGSGTPTGKASTTPKASDKPTDKASTTPKASDKPTDKASTTPKASDTPTGKSSATQSASAKSSTTPTSKAPTVTPSDSRKTTDLVGTDGKGNPKYRLTQVNGQTRISSVGALVGLKGEKVSGATVALYDFTGNARGKKLGETKTNADGSFTFDATLPDGWRDTKNFNVELAFDGDKANKPKSVYMKMDANAVVREDGKGSTDPGKDTTDPGSTTGDPISNQGDPNKDADDPKNNADDPKNDPGDTGDNGSDDSTDAQDGTDAQVKETEGGLADTGK